MPLASPVGGLSFPPRSKNEDEEGQVGWSSEQPGLVEHVPADVRGVGTR